MKAITTTLKNAIAQEVTTLATLWKVTRADGTIYGFTDHDQDIDYGEVTYEATSGHLPSALDQTGDLAVDNLEIVAFLSSDKIKESDLIAGRFDYAEISIFVIDYANIAYGALQIGDGWRLGEITIHDNKFVAEIRSKAQYLQQTILDLYSPDCRAKLGRDNPSWRMCGVLLEPIDWQSEYEYIVGDVVKATSYDGRKYVCTTAGTSGETEPTWDTTIGNSTNDNTVVWKCYDSWTKQGTVTAVTDRRTFDASALSYDDDWFNYGLLTWLTGSNSGLSMEVKDWDNTNHRFILFEKMPFDVEVDDAFSVYAGCDRSMETCKNKFNNLQNFRGEPYIPGVDELLRHPTRSDADTIEPEDPVYTETNPDPGTSPAPGGGNTGGGDAGASGGAGMIVDAAHWTLNWGVSSSDITITINDGYGEPAYNKDGYGWGWDIRMQIVYGYATIEGETTETGGPGTEVQGRTGGAYNSIILHLHRPATSVRLRFYIANASWIEEQMHYFGVKGSDGNVIPFDGTPQ